MGIQQLQVPARQQLYAAFEMWKTCMIHYSTSKLSGCDLKLCSARMYTIIRDFRRLIFAVFVFYSCTKLIKVNRTIFHIVNHSRRLLVRDSETSARRESFFGKSRILLLPRDFRRLFLASKSRILPVGVMVRSGCLGDFYHVNFVITKLLVRDSETDFDHLTNYIHSREYFFTFRRGDKKRDKKNVITFTT